NSASLPKATRLWYSVCSLRLPVSSLPAYVLVARRSFATYVPFGVALTSGSAVRLPTRMTLLTIASPPRYWTQPRSEERAVQPRLLRKRGLARSHRRAAPPAFAAGIAGPRTSWGAKPAGTRLD